MGIQGVPLDKSKILEAITLKKGIIEHVAKLLDCSPQSIYTWMDKDEDVRKAIDEERARAVKERIEAERRIVESAYATIETLVRDEKDVTATLFTLKCKAGWNDRPQQDNSAKLVHEKPFDENNKNSPSIQS